MPADSGARAGRSRITCTATHTMTQADLDAGTIVNSATGVERHRDVAARHGDGHGGADAEALTVAKSSTTTSLSAPTTVTYTYLVTNTGNVTLTGIVADRRQRQQRPELPGDDAWRRTATMTCTATHTFTQAELDANGSPVAGSGNADEHGDRDLERGADRRPPTSRSRSCRRRR